MTIVELKAKAYDLLAQIQFLQQELGKLNEQIAVKSQEENKNVNTTEG